MERISAACAMEWSIELEKALRSKKPGQAVKAIQQFGSRLLKWSREPKPTMIVYNMFGLVPGEDKLFANTILLRLADAFSLGDKDTRVSVVRIFLSEFRNRNKEQKGEGYRGILSKTRVRNDLELLKRVKIVFDTGDVESRALALILFGCWADFAKDSAHIRYLILSSLISSEILEVKASLFAGGCFCELAADFAPVVLEMLLNILISPETSIPVKLAGVRVFSKMGHSYSIANRAHKIGLKLVEDTSEEEFIVTMLVSLSRLVGKSSLLISDQVNLLLSFFNTERSLQVQATALRCLKFIFKEVFCDSTISMRVIKTLVRSIEETELPSAMRYETLQILRKMLLYMLSFLPGDCVPELTQLLKIFEKVAKSSVMSESLLAIHVLVDASTQIREITQIESDGDYFKYLEMRIISTILDHITSFMKPSLDVYEHNSKSKVFQEFQSLLNLLLSLVRADPNLGVLVLDKVGSFIGCLVDACDSSMATRETGALLDDLVDIRRQKNMDIGLNMVNSVHKFFVSCIENLNEHGTINTETIDKVKFLVDRVHRCRLFDQYTYIAFSMMLQSQIFWSCVINENENLCIVGKDLDNPLCKQLVEYEIHSLEHIEKVSTVRNNWPAYKAGKFALYQGAWVSASYLFGQLIGKTQSDYCTCWLKALAQFVESEGKIQLFLLPNLRSRLVDWLKIKETRLKYFGRLLDEIDQCAIGNINDHGCTQVLSRAHDGICSAKETLKATDMLGRSCYFQRWFLALREKMLRAVVDVLNVLGTVTELNINDGQAETGVLDSLRQITQISLQLRSLAQELDLIATSFMGMDSRSSKIISVLALSCSLLAFTTGFALIISDLDDHEIITGGLESSRICLQVMSIQNLVGRLWLVDQEICSKLWMLSDVNGGFKAWCHLQPRNHILNSGEVRHILNVCRYVVSGISGLQNKTKGVHNDGILSHISNDGFQLVLKTLTTWLHIPFRVPKYFFKVRPCIGVELFVFNADSSRNSDELTVFPGFQLPINLCLRLRNVPPNLAAKATKLYCVLCYSASFWEPRSNAEENRGQMKLDYEEWEMCSMICMNEKLLRYVKKTAEKTDDCLFDNDSNDGIFYRFVCFEPYYKEEGQGFSNCLVDVSHFPVGCYRIKWHSCCMDAQGCYWSLLPLNMGPVFTVQESPAVG